MESRTCRGIIVHVLLLLTICIDVLQHCKVHLNMYVNYSLDDIYDVKYFYCVQRKYLKKN